MTRIQLVLVLFLFPVPCLGECYEDMRRDDNYSDLNRVLECLDEKLRELEGFRLDEKLRELEELQRRVGELKQEIAPTVAQELKSQLPELLEENADLVALLKGPPGNPGKEGRKGDKGEPGPTNIRYKAFTQIEVSDGSGDTKELMTSDRSFCSLKKVGIWDNGDRDEISFCELYIDKRKWILKAVSNGSSHTGCVAHCISWP